MLPEANAVALAGFKYIFWWITPFQGRVAQIALKFVLELLFNFVGYQDILKMPPEANRNALVGLKQPVVCFGTLDANSRAVLG